eukprot:TRINITY_DN3129_c0_g1_i2.p1 TRINITY_DN3129_c0_g1~~TRINITY_DN3129_c0_g1_i2.p1  ORF type:complete len:216 (+),score=8.27 TRINITY_DN3129_c0_g1_i2:72-719(+)
MNHVLTSRRGFSNIPFRKGKFCPVQLVFEHDVQVVSCCATKIQRRGLLREHQFEIGTLDPVATTFNGGLDELRILVVEWRNLPKIGHPFSGVEHGQVLASSWTDSSDELQVLLGKGDSEVIAVIETVVAKIKWRCSFFFGIILCVIFREVVYQILNAIEEAFLPQSIEFEFWRNAKVTRSQKLQNRCKVFAVSVDEVSTVFIQKGCEAFWKLHNK